MSQSRHCTEDICANIVCQAETRKENNIWNVNKENKKLLHAFTTGQEEHSKPESSAAKLYCLHLQEQECKSQSKRENGETPSPFRRIILRLGRITPWLAAAHQPSCRHGEGRAHGVENYPWHMRRLFVYHLEHRMSAPSCNGECEGSSPHPTHPLPLFGPGVPLYWGI